MSKKIMRTMDGNEAAAYISYAFTEVATIYPITPSSPMAELVDKWSAQGKNNLFGQTVKLMQMQSEAGAAGAMHGALETGSLATSYTASQGLLLMIPPMYRIAGQLHPGVLHVSARTVGTHAFSIFGDHSDVMATRQTGFAMLASGSVQEVMDLSGVAHLSAIKGRVPFLSFFDGFRTSHEIQKVEVMDYSDLDRLLDRDALDAFRKRSLNPERPVMRSTVENPDTFFQHREASNPYYDAIPEIVEDYMNDINKITGRNYGLFNYYGAEDAEHVVIAMGSVDGVIRETVDYLRAKGEKVGYLQVHLYRPFSIKHFLRDIPATVKKITVLDRTKEPGALGEPLYLDICGAFNEAQIRPSIYAGRYGLSSKDVTANQIIAVYENMKNSDTRNHFTVGIEDDVTNLSLKLGEAFDVVPKGTVSCKFWGLGSDGTVGANKNSIKIIGDYTDMYVQAYFEYDTKKSGGVTRSHLRFGKEPIRGSYLVTSANFVACHNPSYINKYDIVQELKADGTFLLNCSWNEEELDLYLPNKVKRYIAENGINFYTIDAVEIAKEIGLGNRTNTILQSAFFKLANIIPFDDAVKYMKDAIDKSYGNKGEKIVNMNYAAVDQGSQGLRKVTVPESWLNVEEYDSTFNAIDSFYMREVGIPINSLKGDDLPVSAFKDSADGTVPTGTSKFEKRGIAIDVPEWIPENCIQCNQCSYVCPHATIRPFLLNEEEVNNTPEGYEVLKAKGKGMEGYSYRIQVTPLDCVGCYACAEVCPAKEKALVMKPFDSQKDQAANWEFSVSLSKKENPMKKTTLKGSQFETPLLEFSGACSGCGETPYMKLATQLFGERMIIANATGCTQAWGAAAPSFPYTKNEEGHGPAFSNSLFENNAEFSIGMVLSMKLQRERIAMWLDDLKEFADSELSEAIDKWFEVYDENELTVEPSRKLIALLESKDLNGQAKELKDQILNNKEHLTKKSMWMYGGDGWAYDIGFGGLDHVLASGEDVNILVVDTEIYSNTGGQSSKASQLGAVAQFAFSGKKTPKKDLGLIAMQYGNCYVAQVGMGANPNQLIKAMVEAEKFKGPSLIIAYAPCISHGIYSGMGTAQEETKRAVEAGYWHLYRYNPELAVEGKNPFVLDSKEPSLDLREFMDGEVRFKSLTRSFPDEAERLLEEAKVHAKRKYETYKKMSEN